MSVADIDVRGKGASPGEWDAVIAAGLLEQMLPVVQNPGLPRSPASALKTVGKVPSQLNAYGEVVGFPQWTKHVTTAEEVAKWRRNLDIGISIRLGAHMAAIDCDVDDKAVAEGILAIARRYFGDAAPIRVRADSPRWLMPIRTVGFTTAKRRYTLRCGDVPEILGDGCQFVACGTHPRGCRYRWIGNIKDMPSVTSETFEAFIREMVDTYGTGEELICRVSSRAPAGDDADVIFDRLYHWIKKNLPFDERRPGELDIPCPWEHEHSSGKTLDGSTTYYCAGTHGYAAPAFVCMHAHCSGRGLPDFEAWAATKGYERTTAADFEGIEAYLEKEEHTDGTLKTQEEKAHYAECMYRISRFKDEKSGKIAANLSTVVAALQAGRDYCGVDVRHDTFRSSEVYREKATEDWRPLTDARTIVARKFLLENRGFGSIPRDLMRDAVLAAGYEDTFDSMKDYLELTLPEWDGVDRITNFFARYCASADTPLQWAIARYMWAALYGRATSPEGIKADIVIVLVGRQGARKSTLVRALAPPRRPCRRDLARNPGLRPRPTGPRQGRHRDPGARRHVQEGRGRRQVLDQPRPRCLYPEVPGARNRLAPQVHLHHDHQRPELPLRYHRQPPLRRRRGGADRYRGRQARFSSAVGAGPGAFRERGDRPPERRAALRRREQEIHVLRPVGRGRGLLARSSGPCAQRDEAAPHRRQHPSVRYRRIDRQGVPRRWAPVGRCDGAAGVCAEPLKGLRKAGPSLRARGALIDR